MSTKINLGIVVSKHINRSELVFSQRVELLIYAYQNQSSDSGVNIEAMSQHRSLHSMTKFCWQTKTQLFS